MSEIVAIKHDAPPDDWDDWNVRRDASSDVLLEIEDVDEKGSLSFGEMSCVGDHLKWEVDAGMVEWCLDDHIPDDLRVPGWIMFERVTVDYVRGDGWTTDDDAVYDVGVIRRATPEEIADHGFSPSQVADDGIL